MHAQEVAQEVLVPQEHASGEKKLNCALSTRSSKPKKFKILSTRSCKKLRVLPQTKNIRRTLQQVALPAIDRFRTMCTANVYGKMQFWFCSFFSQPLKTFSREKEKTYVLDNTNNFTSLQKWLKGRRQKLDKLDLIIYESVKSAKDWW